MQDSIPVKLLVLSVLTVLFIVPLMFIWGVVSERAGYRDRVAADVAASSAKSQTLIGPLLAVRYHERVTIAATADKPSRVETIERVRVILPDSLEAETDVRVEKRRKGIYEVPVYRAANRMSARFTVPGELEIESGRQLVGTPTAAVVMGVSDSRGLRDVTFSVAGEPVQVMPGSGLRWLANGFRAEVAGPVQGRTFDIALDLELIGTSSLSVLPVGGTTRVTMHSDWPHPGFGGGFLPDDHTVSGEGFDATWSLSRLATGVDDAVARMQAGDDNAHRDRDLAVRFVQPVDVYQQSERSVKYGMLFVLITFVAFFLFEVLRGLRIHPIQYGMCAAGLVVFFLLVLSLSEHVPFAAAYLTASLACVGLVTFYVIHVLGSATRGLGFGVLLGGAYALLYVILQSEDFALLLGSTLVFAGLATVMIITRRLDWYGVGRKSGGDASGGGVSS